MTVSDLIHELNKFEGDVRVVIRGYEDGVDDIDKLKIVKIKLDQNKEWYCGKHNITQDNEDGFDAFALLLTTK